MADVVVGGQCLQHGDAMFDCRTGTAITVAGLQQAARADRTKYMLHAHNMMPVIDMSTINSSYSILL